MGLVVGVPNQRRVVEKSRLEEGNLQTIVFVEVDDLENQADVVEVGGEKVLFDRVVLQVTVREHRVVAHPAVLVHELEHELPVGQEPEADVGNSLVGRVDQKDLGRASRVKSLQNRRPAQSDQIRRRAETVEHRLAAELDEAVLPLEAEKSRVSVDVVNGAESSEAEETSSKPEAVSSESEMSSETKVVSPEAEATAVEKASSEREAASGEKVASANRDETLAAVMLPVKTESIALQQIALMEAGLAEVARVSEASSVSQEGSSQKSPAVKGIAMEGLAQKGLGVERVVPEGSAVKRLGVERPAVKGPGVEGVASVNHALRAEYPAAVEELAGRSLGHAVGAELLVHAVVISRWKSWVVRERVGGRRRRRAESAHWGCGPAVGRPGALDGHGDDRKA